MNILKFIFIALLASSLFSCKKHDDETITSSNHFIFSSLHDTIKPLRYYPVFPGSFWTYLNEKNDTVKYYTFGNYMKDCFAPGFTDTVFVPFLVKPKYGPAPIYQYDQISHFTPYVYGQASDKRTPILSEIQDKTFKRGGTDFRYSDYRATMLVIGKFKINNDSVLILKGYSGLEFGVFHEHYTKDIGLTLSYATDSITNDTISKLRLINYYINH
jgi:hypothetical protein